MKSSAKKRIDPQVQVFWGLFSRREAGILVSRGAYHVHSTALGDRDVNVRETVDAINEERPSAYAWEKNLNTTRVSIRESSKRWEVIHSIISTSGLEQKRSLRERVESVAEELITNAIFHSYQKKDGSSKYNRRENVVLTDKEAVTVDYAITDEGLYLSVSDHGGHLTFDEIARSFARCYSDSTEQIETKEGGAGLGLYMIVEASSHMKVYCEPGKISTVTCWIADKKSFDPNYFSFNYFHRRR